MNILSNALWVPALDTHSTSKKSRFRSTPRDIKYTTRLSELEKQEKTIRDFASLKDDWDSYGAEAISADVVSVGITCLREFVLSREIDVRTIAPTPGDSIYFKLLVNGIEVHVDAEEDQLQYQVKYDVGNSRSGNIRLTNSIRIDAKTLVSTLLDLTQD